MINRAIRSNVVPLPLHKILLVYRIGFVESCSFTESPRCKMLFHDSYLKDSNKFLSNQSLILDRREAFLNAIFECIDYQPGFEMI